MISHSFFNDLSELRWEYLPWIALLYSVPLLGFLLGAVQYGRRWLLPFTKLLGMWELVIAPLRDWVLGPFLLIAVVWNISQAVAAQHLTFAPEVAFAIVVAVVVAWLHRGRRKHAKLRFLEFISRYSDIHPQESVDHLCATAGPLRDNYAHAPYRRLDPASVDFRGDAQRPMRAAVLRGVWCTLRFSRLILLAHRSDEQLMHRAANAIAVQWSMRLLQLARAAFVLEQRERLRSAPEHVIYTFTHGSLFDFVAVPLLLWARCRDTGQMLDCVPRFLLAKDHFRDNAFLYRVVGIGRVAECLGMIFIDRVPVTSDVQARVERARAVTSDAAACLIEGHLPLALFPQGTRARPHTHVDGSRGDVSYYAVGKFPRLTIDGAYLKKGAAHMVVEASRLLHERNSDQQVALLPIAILGAAVICPRKSLRLQANVTIRFRIGEPIVALSKGSVDERVVDVHRQLDHALRGLLKTHAELDRRYVEMVRSLFEPLQQEEALVSLQAWRGEDVIVYQLLDYIYCCDPKHWRSMAGELTHLLVSDAPRDDLVAFREKVAKVLVGEE